MESPVDQKMNKMTCRRQSTRYYLLCLGQKIATPSIPTSYSSLRRNPQREIHTEKNIWEAGLGIQSIIRLVRLFDLSQIDMGTTQVLLECLPEFFVHGTYDASIYFGWEADTKQREFRLCLFKYIF